MLHYWLPRHANFTGYGSRVVAGYRNPRVFSRRGGARADLAEDGVDYVPYNVTPTAPIPLSLSLSLSLRAKGTRIRNYNARESDSTIVHLFVIV